MEKSLAKPYYRISDGLHKLRKRKFPVVPSIEVLDNFLETNITVITDLLTIDEEQIYKGSVYTNLGDCALMFINPRIQKEALSLGTFLKFKIENKKFEMQYDFFAF